MTRFERRARRTVLDQRDSIDYEYGHLSAGERLQMVCEPQLFEMLDALSAAGADYLVVGAHALAVHARPRATGDLDVWIRPTPENAARVWHALVAFGVALDELKETDLVTPELAFEIGRAPERIDLLTSITGVSFDDAWSARVVAEVDGRFIPVIGREHLITNKRAMGRLRDLADLQDLAT